MRMSDISGAAAPAAEQSVRWDAPPTPDDLHAAYAVYAPAVLQLRQNRGTALGNGHFKHVYALPEWEDVVAKEHSLPTTAERQHAFAEEEPALIRMCGLEGFEQVRATSPAHTIVITDRIEGVTTEKADVEMLDALSVPLLRTALGQLAVASNDRGIWLDRHPGNIMLGQAGLHFLDPEPDPNWHPIVFGSNVETLACALADTGSKIGGIDKTVRAAALQRLSAAATAEHVPAATQDAIKHITDATQHGVRRAPPQLVALSL